MKIVTAEQMRNEDRNATEIYKIPGLLLMENAAKECVRITEQEICLENKKIAVVCGGGNNGGDGFAIARLLYCRGYRVFILNVGNPDKLPLSTKTNYDATECLGIPETDLNEEFDVIFECLLGVGLQGDVREEAAMIIDKINQSDAYVVSVDVPGGICADSGRVCRAAVKADITVTMGYGKPGLYTGEGKKYAGKVFVADISLPPNRNGNYFLTDVEMVENWLPESDINAHKGSNGTLLVVAGSAGMTGAATLCCEGALRAGVGIVKLAVPENLNSIFEVKLTEVITCPLSCENFFNESVADETDKLLGKASAVVIGPGVGRNEQTVRFVHKIIKKAKIPVVIDADGIYAVSLNINILKEADCPVILTPHPGEFSMLTGKAIDEINQNRLFYAQKFAEEFGVTLLLKGAGTVVATPDGTVYVNPTGNEGMAKGGSGDILAGIIGAFVCRGVTEPAAAGAFIHGRAGDRAAEVCGKTNMLPSDILKYI